MTILYNRKTGAWKFYCSYVVHCTLVFDQVEAIVNVWVKGTPCDSTMPACQPKFFCFIHCRKSGLRSSFLLMSFCHVPSAGQWSADAETIMMEKAFCVGATFSTEMPLIFWKKLKKSGLPYAEAKSNNLRSSGTCCCLSDGVSLLLPRRAEKAISLQMLSRKGFEPWSRHACIQ